MVSDCTVYVHLAGELLMFERILIANRGAIAARLVRASHEAGAEAVAVYSEADPMRRTLGKRTRRSS